jgi:hypothetical protein
LIYENQFIEEERLGMKLGDERPQIEKVRFVYALKAIVILGGFIAIWAIIGV